MITEIQVRPSQDSDISPITDIYAHHVLRGTGSFEVDPPDAGEMARRRAEVIGQGLPFLIAEKDDLVLGYAYAALYRTRIAYRYTLEDSVYIHPGHLGHGIGALLLSHLIPACKDWGCRQLVAVIGDSENRASV